MPPKREASNALGGNSGTKNEMTQVSLFRMVQCDSLVCILPVLFMFIDRV